MRAALRREMEAESRGGRSGEGGAAPSSPPHTARGGEKVAGVEAARRGGEGAERGRTPRLAHAEAGRELITAVAVGACRFKRPCPLFEPRPMGAGGRGARGQWERRGAARAPPPAL